MPMKPETGLVMKARLLGVHKLRKAKDCPQPPEAKEVRKDPPQKPSEAM